MNQLLYGYKARVVWAPPGSGSDPQEGLRRIISFSSHLSLLRSLSASPHRKPRAFPFASERPGRENR